MRLRFDRGVRTSTLETNLVMISCHGKQIRPARTPGLESPAVAAYSGRHDRRRMACRSRPTLRPRAGQSPQHTGAALIRSPRKRQTMTRPLATFRLQCSRSCQQNHAALATFSEHPLQRATPQRNQCFHKRMLRVVSSRQRIR